MNIDSVENDQEESVNVSTKHSSGADVLSQVSLERRVLPRLDFHLETNRERPVTLLIEEESGLIIAELSASENRLKDAQEIVRRCNAHDTLVAALESIRDSPHCSYDSHSPNHDNYSLFYATGVADGHRCAANSAREALAALALAGKPDTGAESRG